MSVLLMGLVWNSTIRDRTQLDVLLYLADRADDDGTNCFPSITRVARFTRCSERTVQRTIAELEREGWVKVVALGGNGAGNTTQFFIDPEKLKGCQDGTLAKWGKRVTIRQRRVTSTTNKGDIDDNPPAPPIGRHIKDTSGDTSVLFHEGEPRGGSEGDKSPASSKKKSTAQDDRFNDFREDHDKAFRHLNREAPAPWDAKESSNLLRWLKANPTITREQWREILRNRARSPVTHGDPLSTWIHRSLNWLKPQGGNRNGNGTYKSKGDRVVDAGREALANLAARYGSDVDGAVQGSGSEREDSGAIRGEVVRPAEPTGR